MAAADLPIGSLFSGVGGLDLGVQAALGCQVIWHAENDRRAADVLARHWPQVPNLGDVRAIDWHQVEPVCVLTAGFPCQDLSVAGPRTGLAPESRSGLWHHVVTAVDALQPCLVVIENVRGLLSTHAGTEPVRQLEPCSRCMGDPPEQPRLRALGVLLADLADLGYDASWTCVRASDVGAPHRRERVFLAAWLTTPVGREAVEDADVEPGPQRRLPAPRQAQGRRSRPYPCRRGRAPAAHPQGQRRSQRLAEPALPQRHPHPCLHRGRAPRDECGLSKPRAAVAHPDIRRCARWTGHDPQASGRHEPEDSRNSPARWWGAYLPAIRRWECVTARAAPAPTQAGSRRLSADFVEWMMGLPPGWVTETEGLSRAAKLHLLGNSVVPRQAAYALGTLLPDGLPVHGRWSRSGQGPGGE
ncbi:DNA (cytosine-5-)-methyltransferase [Streptomyces sp. NPDC050844]|uniref:DNA cytosine methyltransferase n=1 Tax=Streptomyces sp. NPDC050844 TaxID=3155790 RepID=UPI0033FAD4A8